VLHKEIPFLRIGLPLCAGIISGLYIKPDNVFLSVSAIVILAGFIVSLFYNKCQTNTLFGITLSLSLFMLGLLLYKNEKTSLSELKAEQSIFVCTLSDFPAEKENSFLMKVKIHKRCFQDSNELVKGSMLLYNKKDNSINSFLPGDILLIKCTPVEITNRGNPYEFNYKFFMENHGIKYYAFTSGNNISLIQKPENRKLAHRALIIRENIIDLYRNRGITGRNLAIVSAVILGQKNMLDQEQKQNFIRAGVMHIMAVSGLHAVILSMFIFSLLFFLKGRYNFLRILITIVFLWAFAFVTGLTPSVMRATLMFTFIQAGSLIRRRVNSINSVLASAFILILIRPSVIFDAGFLLSYSAVIYIISFYQAFYQKLQFNNLPADKIWQSAVVTIIAQAGTLPLTIMLFNRFPVYFIITNLIIVPLSSMLIVTGCIVPLVYPIKFFSALAAKVLNFMTGLTENLTAIASDLPGSGLENIGMTTADCILLTITLFLLTTYLLKKEALSVLYPAIFLILVLGYRTVNQISTKRSNELIVYNTPGTTTIAIRTGRVLNVYSDSSRIKQEVMKHSSTLGLKIKSNVLNKNLNYIDAGKKILILNSFDERVIQRYKPDIVILTGMKSGINVYSNQEYLLPALVITSESPHGFTNSGRHKMIATDTVHFVRKSGAFVKSI
jgi:competence protein ComEC